MTLTIGSLFAGIGGFDLGFERAGFRTVWQCEIDKAAQGVLRRRFPAATLHSDVRQVGAHNLEPVDVITFGSPCQDLSVAGKRAGLAGERSGLFHEAARVIRELRERYGSPRFAIWENVPGAFSSNGGADFAAVVQTMVDLGARDICWRVLDSRYFGVAQRRRRVFLVADFGGECAEQILFERESLLGDSAKGGKARKEASRGAGAGAAGGGYIPAVTGCLDSGAHPGSYNGQDAFNDRIIAQPIPMIGSKGNAVAQADGPSFTLNAMHGHDVHAVAVPTSPIPFDTTQLPSPSNYSSPKAGDPYHPLAAGAHPPAVAFGISSDAVDRSGEGDGSAAQRAGLGITVEVSPALRARPNNSVALAAQPGMKQTTYVAQAVEPFTLEVRGRDGECNLEYRQDGTANCLRGSNGGRAGMGVGAVALAAQPKTFAFDGFQSAAPKATVQFRVEETAPLISTRPHCVGPMEPIAFHPTQDPISSEDGVSHAMTNGSKGGTATVAVAVPSQSVCATGEVTHALTCGASDGATEDGTGRETPITVQRILAPTLTAANDPSRSPQSAEVTQQVAAVLAAQPAMQVRRLTPTECERLQGFPDSWTSEATLPDGTIKPQADGPRYKQLGNAVTVNVAEWIGRRLAATLQP